MAQIIIQTAFAAAGNYFLPGIGGMIGYSAGAPIGGPDKAKKLKSTQEREEHEHIERVDSSGLCAGGSR